MLRAGSLAGAATPAARPSPGGLSWPLSRSQARDGSRCDSGRGTAGLRWTPQDRFLTPPRADLGLSAFTDAGRTERQFHAASNEETAGQPPFRWAGMSGL